MITVTGKVTETWKRQVKFTKTGKDYIDRKVIQRKGTFSAFFRPSHL